MEEAREVIQPLSEWLSEPSTQPLLYGRDMDLSYLAISDDEYDKDIFPASYYMTNKKVCLQALTPEPAPQSLMDNMDIDVDNEVFLGGTEDENQ